MEAREALCGQGYAEEGYGGQVAVPVPKHDEDEEGEVTSKFRIEEKLGEGTYGKVYRARRLSDDLQVALKKIGIFYEDEGVPSTAIREISLLKECDHPNVIKLHEVYSQWNAVWLVFEFLDMDLRMYLKTHDRRSRDSKAQDYAFSKPMLQRSAYQVFRAIEYCHNHRVLHRDLKPQNVLVDVATTTLKLADFGLARAFSVPLKAYTHEVVTLWYRSPEILLGQGKYATPVDIWSLGCILAEMATTQALFPGDSEIDTLFKIFQVLGTPDETVWPGVTLLPDYKTRFPQWQDTRLENIRQAGPMLEDLGVQFLRECLRYNPVDRPSAMRALRHPYFEGVDRGPP